MKLGYFLLSILAGVLVSSAMIIGGIWFWWLFNKDMVINVYGLMICQGIIAVMIIAWLLIRGEKNG